MIIHNKYKKRNYLLFFKYAFILLLTLLIINIKGIPGHKILYNKFLEEKYDSRNSAFNKSLNFIKNCQSSELFKYKPPKFNLNNPKISVVIPLYNCENYVLKAIKSIQLQSILDIEILLIDDKSSDNTINLVTKMQNEDKRIKLFRNQKNMGILYSRSIGVLLSIGKYLFTLDNDDLFISNDIFETITKISQEGNFDIVKFKAISNKNYNQNILNKNIIDSKYSYDQPFILFQPELGRFPISTGENIEDFQVNDIYLWGKCIKTQIYQKALKKLGYERYSRFMLRYEDVVTNYMIFNIANSFISVQKYGIYHFVRKGSAAHIGLKKVNDNINFLYLIDIVTDFALDNYVNKKLPASLLFNFIKYKVKKKCIMKSKYYMNLFISCFNRISNSSFVSEKYKRILKKSIKKLKLKK